MIPYNIWARAAVVNFTITEYYLYKHTHLFPYLRDAVGRTVQRTGCSQQYVLHAYYDGVLVRLWWPGFDVPCSKHTPVCFEVYNARPL